MKAALPADDRSGDATMTPPMSVALIRFCQQHITAHAVKTSFLERSVAVWTRLENSGSRGVACGHAARELVRAAPGAGKGKEARKAQIAKDAAVNSFIQIDRRLTAVLNLQRDIEKAKTGHATVAARDAQLRAMREEAIKPDGPASTPWRTGS